MTKIIDYNKELNPAQLEAVLSTAGPHLIIAGAGSGKTRVLVFRTAYLVEKGISPGRILLLTFTRKAAGEMIKRATDILDDRCQKVAGGTFHSFANSVLRRYAEHIGLSRTFTIMDQSDAESAVNLLRTRLGFNKVDKRFPKKQTLLSLISKSVNKCTDLDTIICEEAAHLCEYSGAMERIREEYVRYKRDLSLLDYDDLLVFLKELLASNKEVRRELSERYQYIMVDEYQDTNKIQAEIIRLLTDSHKNIMVVGDDSQSIYSFRGAHFKNIIDFPNIYPDTKVIMLEQNYRSSQPILDLTNEVINCADEKFDKRLFTDNGGHNLPIYVDVGDGHAQSRYIADKIFTLRSKGMKLNQIAILFRSGWHSNDLEVELARHGIPFVKYGGQKFIEAAHIKDILAFLRVSYNPYDQVSWLRVLGLLRGIGPKTAIQIAQLVQREGKGVDLKTDLLPKKNEVKRLFEVLKEVQLANISPVESLKVFMEFYYPLLLDHYDDYDKRLNDLESLQDIAARYQSLETLLVDMALEPPEKSLVDAQRHRQRDTHLVLSTIHSAKGLEWDTVFLIYCAEGYLPSFRSLEQSAAIEEERRLFYVATTRAKEYLYLLRPQIDRSNRSGMDRGIVYTRVSRFLEEGGILNRFVQIDSEYMNNYYAFSDSFEI